MEALFISETLAPGASGWLVKNVQEWLTLSGYPVPITATFDDATAAAVSQFRYQRALGDGTAVSPHVYSALIEPLVRAIAPVKPGADFASTVLSIAERQLSLNPLEVGGQNRGPWVRLYLEGTDGEATRWGAGFVTWCMKMAALARGEALPLPSLVSADSLATEAYARGLFVGAGQSRARVKRGHFFLVRDPSVLGWVHVGIVRSLGVSHFETIEGNSSETSQTNGDRVLSRRRPLERAEFIVLESTSG